MIDQPIEVEDYNESEHKEIINYRQLSSSLLREDLEKLLENVSFGKSSIFVNF